MNGMRHGFGAGFDELPNKQTFRDFMVWWNSESWFPADDEVEVETALPLAA